MDAGLELAEAAAYGALFESAGLPVLRIGGAVCTVARFVPDNPMLNRVTGLGLDGPADDGELDEIESFFAAHGTRYAVAVSPSAPPDLGRRLRERGFADGYAWMKFRRGVDEPQTAGTALRVVQVSDGTDFGPIVSAAFGLPAAVAGMFEHLPELAGWHCFVAYDGDSPAGVAAMFAHEGIGWLGAAGTVEQHRGKGAQTALLAARIRRARELGLDAVTTETGERTADRPSASYRNILRAGFAEAYVRPNLVLP